MKINLINLAENLVSDLTPPFYAPFDDCNLSRWIARTALLVLVISVDYLANKPGQLQSHESKIYFKFIIGLPQLIRHHKITLFLGVYTCPYCRHELGEKYEKEVNKACEAVLAKLFSV